MKPLNLIFFADNLDAARAVMTFIRHGGTDAAQIRHAPGFVMSEKEHDAVAVLLMPDVSDYDAKRITEIYGDLVKPAPPSGLPLPPPPPIADPLANLPTNWQALDAATLKKIAEAASAGRSVENKAQAIQVIEAALQARKK